MTSAYVEFLFIFIRRVSYSELTPDNADQLFALVISPGLYLHHIEVAYQDPANRNTFAV